MENMWVVSFWMDTSCSTKVQSAKLPLMKVVWSCLSNMNPQFWRQLLSLLLKFPSRLWLNKFCIVSLGLSTSQRFSSWRLMSALTPCGMYSHPRVSRTNGLAVLSSSLTLQKAHSLCL